MANFVQSLGWPLYTGSTIYIYICNELIEETAKHRKLIFGMWESKFLKLTNLVIFRVIWIITVGQRYFEMLSPL